MGITAEVKYEEKFMSLRTDEVNLYNNGQGSVSMTLARIISGLTPGISLKNHLIYKNNILLKVLQIILEQLAGNKQT